MYSIGEISGEICDYRTRISDCEKLIRFSAPVAFSKILATPTKLVPITFQYERHEVGLVANGLMGTVIWTNDGEKRRRCTDKNEFFCFYY